VRGFGLARVRRRACQGGYVCVICMLFIFLGGLFTPQARRPTRCRARGPGPVIPPVRWPARPAAIPGPPTAISGPAARLSPAATGPLATGSTAIRRACCLPGPPARCYPSRRARRHPSRGTSHRDHPSCLAHCRRARHSSRRVRRHSTCQVTPGPPPSPGRGRQGRPLARRPLGLPFQGHACSIPFDKAFPASMNSRSKIM
jgi:hypothetical protein